MKAASILLLCAATGSATSFVLPRKTSAPVDVTSTRKMSRVPAVSGVGSAMKIVGGLRGGMDFTTTVAPALGATIANAMFLSGFSEIMKVRKEGKLGSFNPDPMPILFGNCLGWLTYSFLVKDKFVAIANVPGVLLGLFYSMTMLRLAEPTKGKQLEKMMLLMTGVHVAAGITCAFFLPDRAAMTSLYGLINNAILLMYYGAPLTTIGTVLKSKTSDSIFFPTVALNGLNGLFWSVYALAIKDMYLLTPNAIGAGLAAIQVLLCIVFRKSAKKA